MPILIICSNAACGELLDVPDQAVGKKVRCPRCGTVNLAAQDLPPTPSSPAAPERATFAPPPAPASVPEPLKLVEAPPNDPAPRGRKPGPSRNPKGPPKIMPPTKTWSI